MPLASFPLLISRWKNSCLFYGDYAQYTQLREYLPEDVFFSRLDAINRHVVREYPHVWIDTYLFFLAVLLVIVAAAFSIAARAANLSIWYPLIILILPIIIAVFTTRRKNRYYKRLTIYYESLQSVLKEFNSLDATQQVKWSFRRVRDGDTAATMHLKRPISDYTINFVVDVVQINTENALAEEGETLPAYDRSMMDVVVDIGPEAQQVPGNMSNYLLVSPQPVTAPSSARRVPLSAHPLPPAYEDGDRRDGGAIEMEPVYPPPAYLNEEVTSAPSNTVNPVSSH